LGDVAFNVKTQLQLGKNKPLKSSADLTIASLTYRNYTYNNIKVKGDYTNKTFIGDVDINDANGQLTFGGQIDLNANSYLFNFDANVKKFRPYALNLTTKNLNLEVSFNINSEFAGPNIDHMNGQIVIDSILLANNKQAYYVEDFIIRSNSATKNGKVKTLSIESPILVGMVSGDYTIGSLITSFKNTAANYFPVIGTQTTIKQPTRNNNIQLAFELESTQKLASVLDMPWFTTKTSTINGHYNDIQNELELDIQVPTLSNQRNFVWEDISLALNNENKQINCMLHAQTKTKSNDTISLNLDLKGINDSLKAYLSWDNTLPTISQSGEILVNTHFVSIDNRVNAHIQFLPTQLVIQNAIWDMAASDITTNFKEFTVNDFNLESTINLYISMGKPPSP